jgi:single-stranded DNA-binding protein
MNSFTVTAIGNVATDLQVEGEGKNRRVKIPLIGNDYAGSDAQGEPREIATTVYFTAFGSLADTLTKNVRKGDQLMMTARMQANNYTSNGEKVYSYNFVVEGFRFGRPGRATREELEQQKG